MKVLEEKPVDYFKYEITKTSPVFVLYLKKYHCEKCNFSWEGLEEKTGHLNGIAKGFRAKQHGDNGKSKSQTKRF